MAAARRGVQVDVTIDGFGSPDLSDQFIGSLIDAGVRIHVFDPGKRLLGWRVNLLRRMHRKIVVVDRAIAFVGGINYSADHLADFGPAAKQDYAVEIRGPLVAEIHRFTHAALAQGQRYQRSRQWWRWRRRLRTSPDNLPAVGSAAAMLVVRDNGDHQSDIERQYRVAIRAARERVIIANAYFFPGYRFMKELRDAARRGVDVRLILQGEPDMPIVKTAATMLYHHLLDAGRAHLRVLRPAAARQGRAGRRRMGHRGLQQPRPAEPGAEPGGQRHHPRPRLQRGPVRAARPHDPAAAASSIELEQLEPLRGWQLVRSFLVYHLTRRYPGWASWLPRHVPRLLPAGYALRTPARAARSEPWPPAPCLAMRWSSHGRAAPRRGHPGPASAHPWWPWIRRALSLLFFAAVAALLVRYARNIDWDDVLDSVRNTPGPALLVAALLAAASHLLYSCFDLIGRRYTGHDLPTGTVMAVTFISYAFNLCIGSLVGGVGFRYRLYSRLGLGKGVITRVVSMSMLTNWLGYMLLAGLVFLVRPLELPPSWKMGNHGLQWLGIGAHPQLRWATSWPACAPATGSGPCAATSCTCRPGAWPCCRWRSPASTGA